MGDKGERGVKNLKKWVKSFMDSPLAIYDAIVLRELHAGATPQLCKAV